MEFTLFLEKILNDLWLNIAVYILFISFYFFLFRKRIWSIVDPLFIQVISMASAAYCVYALAFYNSIRIEYSVSFLLSELAFIVGFFIVKNISKVNLKSPESNKVNIAELQIFMWSAAIIYLISQSVSFAIIGVILFKSDTNHVFAYQEHGILRVFLNYSSVIFLIAAFYKRHIVGKYTFLEKALIGVVIICTILGGSKSALLTFFSVFIIVNFIYNKRTGNHNFFKIKTRYLVILVFSAVGIIAVQSSSSIINSLSLLYFRFIGSGDIFVLGYNKNVINSIHEKSGIKYIFYPGIGTFLKFLFNIQPPHTIGVDITEYYTGKTDSGPNARHNYIGLIFWGYWGVSFSFLCGYIVSWIRNKMIFFRTGSKQFLYFVIICLVVYSAADLISDANLFMNNIVWSFFMLVIIYTISSFLACLLLLPSPKVNTSN